MYSLEPGVSVFVDTLETACYICLRHGFCSFLSAVHVGTLNTQTSTTDSRGRKFYVEGTLYPFWILGLADCWGKAMAGSLEAIAITVGWRPLLVG